MQVEEITHAHVDGGEGVLALLVRASAGVPFDPGTRFLTAPDACLQLALMRHPAGHEVQAHVHPPVRRETMRTQELLLVRRGRVRVDFYSTRGEFAASRELAAGDLVLLLHGGHGLTVLEEAELVECKSGPFVGRGRDKVML